MSPQAKKQGMGPEYHMVRRGPNQGVRSMLAALLGFVRDSIFHVYLFHMCLQIECVDICAARRARAGLRGRRGLAASERLMP